MKKMFTFLLATCVVTLAMILLIKIIFGFESDREYVNFKNLSKITIDMNEDSLKRIMGSPDTSYYFGGKIFLNYKMPKGYSTSGQIVIHSMSRRVKYVSPIED
jgi:hypothetical protein